MPSPSLDPGHRVWASGWGLSEKGHSVLGGSQRPQNHIHLSVARGWEEHGGSENGPARSLAMLGQKPVQRSQTEESTDREAGGSFVLGAITGSQQRGAPVF